SIVIVNTGDGKGKSTAAFGTVLRAVARGWQVAVVQFIKSGDWRVGEESICRRLGIDWWSAGDGFSWNSTDLDDTEVAGRAAWDRVRMSLLLLVGGARSGKSRIAQEIGSAASGPVTFIATAEARDEEMTERIRLHRESRPPSWRTTEEPVELLAALAEVPRAT